MCPMILTLLTALPLVASEPSHHALVPPQLLSQGIFQNHGTIIVNHYPNPTSLLDREAPNSSSGPGWGDIVAFVVFILYAGKLWHQSQFPASHDLTRRACPLRCPGRRHTVETGEPRTDHLTLPPRDRAGTPNSGHPVNPRGRTSAAAVASAGPTSYNVLYDQAVLIEEPEHDLAHTIDLTNTQSPTKPEFPPSWDTPAYDETALSPSEPPTDPPNISTNVSYIPWASADRKTNSVPTPGNSPGSKVILYQPRHLSLPFEDGRQRSPPNVKKSTPLQTALYTGSASLSIAWYFLVIAVNYDGVEDPENDLPLFRDLLTQPGAQPLDIHFESLVGSEATILSITTKLVAIYLEAARNTSDSRVLVLLSGSGNDDNQMCLSNGEVITEKILRNLLVKVHMKSNVTDIEPALFVVDICRPNRSKLSIPSCHVVNMIWACSPGQRGYGVGLGNLPNSVFLLALCWAASDLPQGVPSNSCQTFNFEQVFRRRVRQLDRLILSCHNYWHYVEPSCEQCASPVARCDPPEPQVPEGERPGWDTLMGLAELIMKRSRERVLEIVDALTDAIRECSEWERRNTISAKQNPRGATMPMSQGAA